MFPSWSNAIWLHATHSPLPFSFPLAVAVATLPPPLSFKFSSREGRGILTISNNCRPMAILTPLLNPANRNAPSTFSPAPLPLLLPPNTPPKKETLNPNPQNTAASPHANAKVGNTTFRSFRSPAALDI